MQWNLDVPPTEPEVASLLQAVSAVPAMGDILRRLLFQRDRLQKLANDIQPRFNELLRSYVDNYGSLHLKDFHDLQKRLKEIKCP